MKTGTVPDFQSDYRFLSNFFPAKVKYEGIVYPSSEHAFQAAKSHDPAVRKEIRALDTNAAKQAGKRIKLRRDWEHVKLRVMEEILRIKFEDPHLNRELLDTGSMELVEGNTWGDSYWGVCDGKGQNHLGRLLMKIRDELRDQD